jgi:hypothetical protein
MSYPGGKNGAGVYQTIINLMPPHHVYIEPFLGGGAVMRLKRPAALNIGLDLDVSALASLQASLARFGDVTGNIAESGVVRSRFRLECTDALVFLASYKFTGSEVVYCDPPYMHETRGRKNLYRFELDDSKHLALLRLVKALPCRVMLSGYWTKLYSRELRSWNAVSFEAMTRSGKQATEWLWFNFPEPVALHDYRYLGGDFRERERIKRKKQRWVNRLQNMPVLERRALLGAIAEAWDPASPIPPLSADIAKSDDAAGKN